VIVLDEQLLGREVDVAVSQWYPGSVCWVTDLRPGTVIKDDAIPALLSQQRQPSFVTINVSHFWKKMRADRHFCIVCIKILDKDVPRISRLLKLLFGHRNFRTKSQRSGHVFRLKVDEQVQYYSLNTEEVHSFQL